MLVQVATFVYGVEHTKKYGLMLTGNMVLIWFNVSLSLKFLPSIKRWRDIVTMV